MPDYANYKLGDLLGSASSTIGVIIGGVILLSFLSSKYVELMNRYRDLTKDYRQCHGDDSRHEPLRLVIRVYHSRLWLLNRAGWLAGIALLCFIASVLLGGMNMVFPAIPYLKAIGSVGLFLGLLLIGGAMAMEVWESILTRHEIATEVADLDSDAKRRLD